MTDKIIATGVVHKVPNDLRETLISSPDILAKWNKLTSLARNEWICWTTIVKKSETRKNHIERLCSDLLKGKRRPCCWPGCPHRRPDAKNMNFHEISKIDFNDWVSMGLAFWPNHTKEELEKEFRELMLSNKNTTYICKDTEHYVAFINLSLRSDYVQGAKSSPVAYVEGIYVKPKYREKGIAKKLIKIAEKWALEKGCKELASDAELENIDSQKFHGNLGFNEVNKVVSFIKSINKC